MVTIKTLIAKELSKAIKYSPTTLSSGKQSDFYIDCKPLTTSKDFSPIIASLFRKQIGEADAVGGPALGALVMLGALSGRGYYNTFFIRDEQKKHGQRKSVEGQIKPGDSVIIIDDVATTGRSLIRAIDTTCLAFLGKGHINIKKVVVLVDRLEGAKERIERHGYAFESIFTLDDLRR